MMNIKEVSRSIAIKIVDFTLNVHHYSQGPISMEKGLADFIEDKLEQIQKEAVLHGGFEGIRPTIDQVWMQTAVMLSKRSTCERLQVGCVITDMDKRTVLGNGYNGGAKGQSNKCDPSDSCGHLHAEVNALIASGSHDRLKVMYVTTLPCAQCAKAIVNSGFMGVYYLNEHEKQGSKDILKAAGINLIKV